MMKRIYFAIRTTFICYYTQIINSTLLVVLPCSLYLLHSDDVNKMSKEMTLIFFSVDRGINQKRMESVPFFFFVWLIPKSTEFFLKIYFFSFNFQFISTKKSVILTLIDEGLFQTFDGLEIHMIFRLM